MPKLRNSAIILALLIYVNGCGSGGGSSSPASGGGTAPTPTPSAPSLSVNVTNVQVAPSASQALSASGGVPPYSWSIKSGTGNLSAAVGASITYSSATSQNATVTLSDSAAHSIDVAIRVSEPATQVAHGGWDGCVVLDNGSVKCWGFNDGRLQDGTSSNQANPVSIVGLSSGVSKVAWGYGSGCALMTDKTVKCWGLSYYGTTGTGTPVLGNDPATTVSGISDIAELVIGGYHACARTNTGAAYCWGINTNGQIGDGTVTQRNTPYTVVLSATAISIAAGPNHTCAVLSDHTVECWGKNNVGELGDGTTTDQHSPVAVVGLTGVSKVVVGDFHTCALMQDATVECWGRGDSGQLGNNSLTTTNKVPASVVGLANVTLLAAGGGNTCALTGTTLECWGDNQSGAIGSGAVITGNTPFSTPQTVLNISTGITCIAIGPSSWGSTVAAVVNGQVYTWGLDDNGQLGNGTTGTSLNAPALTSPF